MLEKDMFKPIKEYLNGLGYDVKAEVLNVDIMAKKDDIVLIVEMKKSLSMKLLYQGCNRQRLYDNVYLAIFNPGYKIIRSKNFREKLHLLHRLRLGLIVVDVEKNKVEVLLDPKEYAFRQNSKKKKLLMKEFDERKTSVNIGGSTGVKIITVYREQAIEIAMTLKSGPLSTKEIIELTNNKKATHILYKNFYHWFEKIDRGIYKLTELGFEELKVFELLIK
ncbi:DUF2161 family putative PD-(D/E)XK-type phosphodiesterase [Mycoplasmatota bacterium WC30]